MDGTTLIKVEENNLEDSSKGDASTSPFASGSTQTSLHQSERDPLKIETTSGRIAKIKSKQYSKGQKLVNQEKTTVQQQSPTVQVPSQYQCELCISKGKKLHLYEKKRNLLAHVARCHRERPPRFQFQCEVCFKQFKFSSSFKDHCRTHLNQSFTCEICSLTFRKKCNLNKHLVSKHNFNSETLNVKEFPCDLCTNIYYSKPVLELHVVNTHVVDKPLECHVCSKTFIDQKALSNHQKNHDRQSSSVCDVCSKAFKQRTSLFRHLGIEHHRFFRCDKCKKSFSNKPEFDAHSDTEHKMQHTCQICNKTFPSHCSLGVHIKFHKSTEEQNQESDSKEMKINNQCDEYKCELCLKTFDREAYIVAHRLLVHPNSQWPCSKCSRTFTKHFLMKKHEPTHNKKAKPHKCKFCDKSYARVYQLRIHENSKHSNTKHFKCKLCPEAFANFNHLKVHMENYHGGEKPFKCHLCSSTWVTQGCLKSHLREVHFKNDAKKPKMKIGLPAESLVFVCDVCSFETQDDREVVTHYYDHGLPKVRLRRPESILSCKE